MIKFIYIALICLLSFSTIGHTDEATDQVQENLLRILPENMAIDAIEASPMEGVYIVSAAEQVMYTYSKGDFIMVGDVYDTVRKVNLGAEQKAKAMMETLTNIPDSEIILMGGPQKRHVTVFTDIDCFYCQKFHRTVEELDQRGVQVRYLMFPRAGLSSDSYKKAVSVWCADDQATAMTIAKSGGTVEPKECDNPVAEQFELGQRLGVRATPTIIFDTGKVIPGFLKPDELIAQAGELN